MIDSLQEQVNNAKDKLLKLMSVGHPPVDGEMDSSNTNLNSCSTQTTGVQPDMPTTSPPSPQSETSVSPLPLPLPLPLPASPPPYVPPPPVPTSALAQPTGPSGSQERFSSCPPPHDSNPRALSPNSDVGASQGSHSNQRRAVLAPERLSCSEEVPSKPPIDGSNAGPGVAKAEGTSVASPATQPNHLPGTPLLSPLWSGPARTDSIGLMEETVASPPVAGGAWQGFVSSEQLQEILKDLSVDARGRTASFRSHDPIRRASANQVQDELAPLAPRSPCSPFYFRYPSISPYAMRKRRPPFYPQRTSPHHTGLTPTRRSKGETGLPSHQESQETGEHKSDLSVRSHHENHHITENIKEVEAAERQERGVDTSPRWRRRERRRSHRPRCCSVKPFSGHSDHGRAPSDLEMEESRRTQEVELGVDPYGYSDSDSDSSSEDYCYYHRPYCDSCHQGPYASSSDSTSETSDSEYGGVFDLCHATHPVVNFNEDLKPTFV